MVKVWKEAGRVGRHAYIDEKTGEPRFLDATPELIKHWFDSGKKMRSIGLSIPIPLEHQRDLQPMTPAELAAKQLLDNAGFVDDFDLRKVDDDGQQVDAVFALCDIPDAEIVKKLPTTIKWVSPWINSFTDGFGNQWNGVISHLALTTRPRIAKQQPFPSIAMALNAAAKKRTAPTADGYAISRAGLLRPNPLAPAYPIAFSMMSGIALADLPPMKEKSKPKPPEAKPSEAPAEKPGMPPALPEGGEKKPDPAAPPVDPMDPMGQMAEPSLVDPDGDISIYDVLRDLLEAVEIAIEEGDESNFLERLYKGVMDKYKAGKTPDMGMNDMAEPPAPPSAPMNNAQPVVEKPPMYMSANMSMESIQKIQDPTLKAIALSMHEQQGQLESLKKNAIEGAKAQRSQRLAALSPKLKKAAADELAKMAEGAKFSLGADGTVTDELAPALRILEDAMAVDVPYMLTNPQAKFAVMPHPKEVTGPTSEERRREIVNELATAGGGSPIYTNGK